MKKINKLKKMAASILAATLMLMMGAGVLSIRAYAADGTVYTCTINPCYRHPVTGVIEDSGGESAYATGQGMVEGCIYTTGILEVTSDGKYYLTIRMSLMDYTGGHSFWVQNVGDSGWSSPAMGVTGNGTDTNGTTTDICIQVPSENCVVRGAMYVEPMGRDVVFYLYPSDYVQGNNTNMNSTMITENASAGTNSSGAAAGSESTLSGGVSLSAGNTSLQGGDDTAESQENEDSEETTLQSSITEPAQESTVQDDSTLNSAQGLSLSTTGEEAKEQTSEVTAFQQILILTAAMTVSGLILLAAGAGIVYFFRKNWYRWGGAEDDYYYDSDES